MMMKMTMMESILLWALLVGSAEAFVGQNSGIRPRMSLVRVKSTLRMVSQPLDPYYNNTGDSNENNIPVRFSNSTRGVDITVEQEEDDADIMSAAALNQEWQELILERQKSPSSAYVGEYNGAAVTTTSNDNNVANNARNAQVVVALAFLLVAALCLLGVALSGEAPILADMDSTSAASSGLEDVDAAKARFQELTGGYWF